MRERERQTTRERQEGEREKREIGRPFSVGGKGKGIIKQKRRARDGRERRQETQASEHDTEQEMNSVHKKKNENRLSGSAAD